MAIRSFQNRLRKLQDGIATYGLVRAPRPITEDMTAEQAALEYQLTMEQGHGMRPTPADIHHDPMLDVERRRLADAYAATLGPKRTAARAEALKGQEHASNGEGSLRPG